MNTQLSDTSTRLLNKVPEVTLSFWIIKIMATTVGETVADYLAVDAGFGKSITTTAMVAFLIIALVFQLRARRFKPGVYWLAVVLVSVVGTQITDLLTDGLGISLYLSTAVFAVTLMAIFGFWYRSERTLSIRTIVTPKREWFYWAVILCTFSLGTAAGDLATEALALGFQIGVIVFGLLIAATAAAFYFGANAVLTFWIAYRLTRPLGAAMGDMLSQSPQYGGIGLGAKLTSIIFLAIIVAAFFGGSIVNIVLLLALTFWPLTARLLRAQVLSLRGEEFVVAARAVGVRDALILARHVLPNAMPTVLVSTALQIGAAILVEAGLSFLGLGDRNLVSWGYMLNNAQPFIQTAWWMSVFPGLALLTTIVSVNLIGDGLNDAFNVRLDLARGNQGTRI